MFRSRWLQQAPRPFSRLKILHGSSEKPLHRSRLINNAPPGRRLFSSTPKSILVVHKPNNQPVLDAMESVLDHIYGQCPNTKVFHEVAPPLPGKFNVWSPGPLSEKIDLVITLGGDGTILHAASLFGSGPVPPVLSFSMGTLGFLLPFHIDDFEKAFASVASGTATVLNRMRLTCTCFDTDMSQLHRKTQISQVMNEVALHRGNSPHLNTIDVFVDGQHLTEAVADGLIVSTPTGSTAYNLSAGGPIVHPSLSAMVITPICPRSLSFRPLIFPSSSAVTLRIGNHSRSPADVSLDGSTYYQLHPGQSVKVETSPYPVPCINRSSLNPSPPSSEEQPPRKEDDWVRDINSLLQYNATFRSKALLRHSRP